MNGAGFGAKVNGGPVLARKQFARYALVGLASNGILYICYLVLTQLGLGHKTAVTILFAVGVTQTFLLNRRWTFDHDGRLQRAYVRYWAAYAMGYVLNLAMLQVFVDVLGYNHRIVQGLLVLSIAVLLFLAQKFWVFREVASGADTRPGQPARQ